MPDTIPVPAGGGGKAMEGERAADGAGGSMAAMPRREASSSGVVDIGGHGGLAFSVFMSPAKQNKTKQCK